MKQRSIVVAANRARTRGRHGRCHPQGSLAKLASRELPGPTCLGVDAAPDGPENVIPDQHADLLTTEACAGELGRRH